MLKKENSKFKNIMYNSLFVNFIKKKHDDYEKRINYNIPSCEVLSKENIILEFANEYKLNIDLNSREKLKNISNNLVQRLIYTNKASIGYEKKLKEVLKIGVIFSGGTAPGGHNVIAGLFDSLKKANVNSSLFGFIKGFDGMIDGNFIEIKQYLVDQYRNTGGFGMIKTGRKKLDTPNKLDLARKICKKLDLNGIVIIGGDDSNTNAAFLAEKLYHDDIKVVGVPKTIDGDMQFKDINGKSLCPISFGFHTAAEYFSCSINNLKIDARSDAKYWHICKVMGRVAGHLALEVALQTHVNLTILGEEISDLINNDSLTSEKENDYTLYGISLDHLVGIITDVIVRRAKLGKNFGVIVIPEGILEFINEIQVIIVKINVIIANFKKGSEGDFHDCFSTLNEKTRYLSDLVLKEKEIKKYPIWNDKDHDFFLKMPKLLQQGLLTKRDNHGNFQFSQLKTEDILIDLVKNKLTSLAVTRNYSVGIENSYFNNLININNINGEKYGPVLFKNWKEENPFLFHNRINSKKALFSTLFKNNLLDEKNNIPECIEKLFEISKPKFKYQTHFYGYDGRGSNPTYFDCCLAYNLGKTSFHLINNYSTGQMVSILNLGDDFKKWEPIAIPLASLMHIEEKQGKLSLVIKKTMVDLDSFAFKMFKKLRKQWLVSSFKDERYISFNSTNFLERNENIKPITLILSNLGN